MKHSYNGVFNDQITTTTEYTQKLDQIPKSITQR